MGRGISVTKKLRKGVQVPTENDPLLEGLYGAFNSAGVVTTVQSAEEARRLVDVAAGAGEGPTTAEPWFFNVAQQLYFADGTKWKNGNWALKMLNEVEYVNYPYAASGAWYNVGAGQYYKYYDSTLSPKPYRRLVLAFLSAWANTTGGVDLYLSIDGTGTLRSAFNSGGGDQQSNSLFNFGLIEANAEPKVEWGIYGRGSGGSAAFTTDPGYNRFMCIALPVSL